MIRVAFADDHPEIRLSLRLLLRLADDIEIVCETSDGQEALDCATSLQPDVFVIDIQMPGLDGFAVTKEIVDVSLPTRVILVSLNRGSYPARRALEVGAKGFLAKDDLAVSLIPAIRTVYQGELFFQE